MKRLTAFVLGVLGIIGLLAIFISQGTIIVPGLRSGGIVVSDTGWQPSTVFKQATVDLVAPYCSHIRIMLNKFAWEHSLVDNPLGLAYPDYIKMMVDYCRSKGLLVELDLTREADDVGSDYSDQFTDAEQAAYMFTTPQVWIDWGKAVVAKCQPYAISIMNEPRNPLWSDLTASLQKFEDYWNLFAKPSIQQYRQIQSNLVVIVPSCPFYKPSWMHRHINDFPNVYTSFHLYYQSTVDFGVDYQAGSLGVGKVNLEKYVMDRVQGLDWGGEAGLTTANIWFDEYGVYREADWFGTSPQQPTQANWQQFLKDLSDIQKAHNFPVTCQYALARNRYEMLDSGTGYTTFTLYGAEWKNNAVQSLRFW